MWSDLVGRKCRGYSWKHDKTVVFVLESYDASYGFWAVNVDDAEDRHCILERAIDRTFHMIKD